MSLNTEINWFFLNGELHRRLATNRPKNYIKAYNYNQNRVCQYRWDETLHAKQRAYSIAEVAEMVNRAPRTMRHYLSNGIIEASGVAQRNPKAKPRYFFTKDDIMQIRDIIFEHSKDAPWGQRALPTREQLRSMLNAGGVLYYKRGDEFIPVWKAKF